MYLVFVYVSKTSSPAATAHGSSLFIEMIHGTGEANRGALHLLQAHGNPSLKVHQPDLQTQLLSVRTSSGVHTKNKGCLSCLINVQIDKQQSLRIYALYSH